VQIAPTTGGGCWNINAPNGEIHSGLYGIDTTGANSAVATLTAALTALNQPGMRRLVIDPGTYKIDSSINASQSQDWAIAWAPGAHWVASSALESNTLYITDASTNAHTLDLFQPYIDMSSATCSSGTCNSPVAQDTTALYTSTQKGVTLHQPYFYGGTTYDNTLNTHANNGWTPTKTMLSEVYGGTMEGFVGAAIYASGDLIANSPKPIYNLNVYGTRIGHSTAGVQCKFSMNACKIVSGEFYYNFHDTGSFWAGTNNIEPPASKFIVIGSNFKFTQATNWYIQGGTKATIIGNIAQDLGYNDRPAVAGTCGTTPITTAAGLRDDGATDIIFNGNTIEYVDCAQVATVPAILILTDTFNNGADTYDGGAISGTGNSIGGFDRGIYESTSGGNSILPSTFRDTKFNSVASPISAATSVVTGTILDYTDRTTGVFTHTVSGSTAGWIGQATAQSLAAFGNVASGSGTGTLTISVPGALPGDSVTITPTTTVLGQTAGVILKAQATTDQVVVVAYNTSGSAFNFATAESGSTPSKVRVEVARGN